MSSSATRACATGRAHAGDEDEARRLEAKADGLGMEGGSWYQGWFEPPRIRLVLARHQTGQLAELTPAGFDWDREPAPTFLDALAALGDRDRIEAGLAPGLVAKCHGQAFAELPGPGGEAGAALLVKWAEAACRPGTCRSVA